MREWSGGMDKRRASSLRINMASTVLPPPGLEPVPQNPCAQRPVTAEYLAYDIGPGLIGAVTVLMVFATASVVLRFWLRLHRKIGLKLDDWLMGASMVPMCGLIACAYLAVIRGGVGKHFETNCLENEQRFGVALQILYAAQPILIANISLVKFSILAMYYRIFPTRFMKWGCIILGTVTALWAISTLFACVFQCTPIQAAWQFKGVGGNCVNTTALYIGTTGIPNLITDIALLCLPMYEVYKLHTPTSQKIALAASFLLGAMVIVADIFKLQVWVELYISDHRPGDPDLEFLGKMWDKTSTLMIWVFTEHALSVICANIPSLRPILTMFLRWTGVTMGSRDDAKSPPPPPREGLVTIGGSGGNLSGNKRLKGGWTTLMQESMPGCEDPMSIPCYHGQKADMGSDNSSEDSSKRTVNNSKEFDGSVLDISGWPIPASHRVTINSQRLERSSTEVARSWSLRGFHSRPNTASGSSLAVPEMPAIAVTTDTEVAWDRELQRVLLAHSQGVGGEGVGYQVGFRGNSGVVVS